MKSCPNCGERSTDEAVTCPHCGAAFDSATASTVPQRPDADRVTTPLPAPVHRMSGGAIAAIVVACVAAILGVALVIVLAVNSIGNSAEDQFKQIQYCLEHPRARECRPPSFPP
jgi:uncharacterized membrane protein YvbJ